MPAAEKIELMHIQRKMGSPVTLHMTFFNETYGKKRFFNVINVVRL